MAKRKLDPALTVFALTALDAEIARLTALRASVSAPVDSTDPKPTLQKRTRRKLSPEARKRMSEMMKKRWAERRRSKT